MISTECVIDKEIDLKQIDEFEDKVIYNIAVGTREYTKKGSSFPKLTGKLERSELSAPIIGSNKEYGLEGGVDYAKYVWNMNNVNWTNKSTKPQWYYTVFKNNADIIISNAVEKSLKTL